MTEITRPPCLRCSGEHSECWDCDGTGTATIWPARIEDAGCAAACCGEQVEIGERVRLVLLAGQHVLSHDRCPVREIPSHRMGGLKRSWGALGRKAAKLGVSAPTIEVLGTSTRTIREDVQLGMGRSVLIEWSGEVTRIRVRGEMPTVPGGWRALAIVSPVARGAETNIITQIDPDASVEEYRTKAISCDHCGTTRYRKRTLVLEAADGTRVAVGTSCLGDFLPTLTADQVAGQSDIWSMIYDRLSAIERAERDLDDPDAYCGGSKRAELALALPTVALLAQVIGRVWGFVSKSAARESEHLAMYDRRVERLVSTADRISDMMAASRKAAAGAAGKDDLTVERFLAEHLGDADQVAATAAIEWAATQGSARSDYLRNLAAIASAENQMLGERLLGLAASLPSAHQRHLQWEAEREREAQVEAGDAPPKAHLGSIKERLTVEARIVRSREVETSYGLSTLIAMTTTDGLHDLTWWSSRSLESLGLEVGGTYSVTGTVTRHGEFRGTPQTTVNRCKFS